MDANLAFWSGALANLGVIVFCTLTGVQRIRAKDVVGHRRRMVIAMSLVGAFLVAYIVKVAALGREDKTGWTTLDFVILYTHEICVIAMLAGGGVALYRAAKFRAGLGPKLKLPPDDDPLEGFERHKRAGKVAVWSSLAGFITAIGVLAGMFARA